MRRAFTTLSLILALAGCADATLRPTDENLQRIRAATLCLLNAERAQSGLRRLRGQGRPDGGLGVAVILRYTLRLLTLDQLGRAATMICAGLLGMATKFAECTLGQKYREVRPDGRARASAQRCMEV